MAAFAAGCSKPATPRPGGPARVVSFTPAITQVLFDMGLGDQVVGVTRFCKLPAGTDRPEAPNATECVWRPRRLGDAFNYNPEQVLAVRPDVILTQSSPTRFQGIRDINPNVRIVQLTLERLADVPAAMERIGQVLGRPDLAAKHRAAFAARLAAVRGRVEGRPKMRVLFVMGTDRPTVAGAENFVADLIELAGGINAGADIPGNMPWRPTHVEAILKAAPEVLICQVSAGEGAEDARRYWMKWKDLPAAKAGRVVVVTDDRWSIPSTYLAELADELARMIHPELAGGGVRGPPNATHRVLGPLAGTSVPGSQPALRAERLQTPRSAFGDLASRPASQAAPGPSGEGGRP